MVYLFVKNTEYLVQISPKLDLHFQRFVCPRARMRSEIQKIERERERENVMKVREGEKERARGLPPLINRRRSSHSDRICDTGVGRAGVVEPYIAILSYPKSQSC